MSEICGRVNRCDKFFGRYNIYPRAIENTSRTQKVMIYLPKTHKNS